MPSWWAKTFSSKEEMKKCSQKKVKKESFIDTIQHKLQNAFDGRSSGCGMSKRHTGTCSQRGPLPWAPPKSPLPSAKVSRCKSFFVERDCAKRSPLPEVHLGRSNSDICKSKTPRYELSWPLLCKSSRYVPLRLDGVSSNSSSTDSDDDPSDSRLISPLTSDYENGNKTAMNTPSGDHCPPIDQKESEVLPKADSLTFTNQNLPTSPEQGPLENNMKTVPDSSMSSPSGSPMKFPEQAAGCGLGHNDKSPNDRCSPDCSPLPNPQMKRPGRSSRIHSSTVTPLHSRAGGVLAKSPTRRFVDGKQLSHPLPLPPPTKPETSPFSPGYSTSTSPTVSRSPCRAENPMSRISRWKKGKVLGRGAHGFVYLGFDSESGEMCAMKEVITIFDDPKSKESVEHLRHEISHLSRFQHPNIVQYYGSETVDDKLCIYLEYVAGGSIYKLLHDYGPLGETAVRSYTHQILVGLSYLHAKKIIHRDIKGANILVDPRGRVKLADFGIAKQITGLSCPLSLKGSPYWMAPEVIMNNSNGCNLAVDIWSLGCTVLEMATSKPPWSHLEGAAAMFKIGNRNELPAIPDNLSEEGKDFVLRCLQRNPSRRPTAAQLLEHPFVKNAAPVESPILSDKAKETLASLMRTLSSLGIGDGRNISRASEAQIQRNNLSCPVSPTRFPLLRPSPPHAKSSPSTPLTSGSRGAVPQFQLP